MAEMYALRNDKVSEIEKNLQDTTRLLSQMAAIQVANCQEIAQLRYELDLTVTGIENLYNLVVKALNRHESSLEESQRLATSLFEGERNRQENLKYTDKIVSLTSKSFEDLLAILLELNAKDASKKFAGDVLQKTLADIKEETENYELEQESLQIAKQKIIDEKRAADRGAK